jgi:hypothetical protein
VTAPMIWLNCGESSRSQRTPHVWLALIWWSNRVTVFQTRVCSVVVALNSGRAGTFTVIPSSIRIRSTLKKKCARSRMTGPPIVPPNCC